jgi:hypothetical protein
MRRRNLWIGAVGIALLLAWLAAESAPRDAPSPTHDRAERPSARETSEPGDEAAESEPTPPAKPHATALAAKRPAFPDGGIGPEIARPREGLLTPERQALLASGQGPRLRRIEDNARALDLALRDAEEAGDVAAASALRERIGRLQARKAELLEGRVPPRPAAVRASE